MDIRERNDQENRPGCGNKRQKILRKNPDVEIRERNCQEKKNRCRNKKRKKKKGDECARQDREKRMGSLAKLWG